MLLLDEPSLGLAPILVEQIFDIIQEINARGTTVLLVEQNALMALGIANRGYVLQTGEIVLADSADKLRNEASARPTSARIDRVAPWPDSRGSRHHARRSTAGRPHSAGCSS